MSYPAISLATATVGCHRCPQKRLQTARQPPVYTNSSPDHRACNSLTPSAVLTPSIPVHRWIRAKPKTLETIELLAVAAELRARIAMESEVADEDVEVGVKDGVIVLAGSVPSAEDLHAIKELLD